MAKGGRTASAASGKQPGKKRLLRRLEEAYYAHQKAERRAGKLRVQLEREEARLADAAQELVGAQTLMDELNGAKQPVPTHGKPKKKHEASRKAGADAKSNKSKAPKDVPVAGPSQPESKSVPVTADGADASADIAQTSS